MEIRVLDKLPEKEFEISFGPGKGFAVLGMLILSFLMIMLFVSGIFAIIYTSATTPPWFNYLGWTCIILSLLLAKGVFYKGNWTPAYRFLADKEGVYFPDTIQQYENTKYLFVPYEKIIGIDGTGMTPLDATSSIQFTIEMKDSERRYFSKDCHYKEIDTFIPKGDGLVFKDNYDKYVDFKSIIKKLHLLINNSKSINKQSNAL